MPNKWYVQITGEELGPLSDDDLRAMAFKRQLTPDDLVRKDASANWVPAAKVRGLFQLEAMSIAVSGTAALRTKIADAGQSAPPVAATRPGVTSASPIFVEQSEPPHSHLLPCSDCGKRISPQANS